jgi:hypothetical protein
VVARRCSTTGDHRYVPVLGEVDAAHPGLRGERRERRVRRFALVA